MTDKILADEPDMRVTGDTGGNGDTGDTGDTGVNVPPLQKAPEDLTLRRLRYIDEEGRPDTYQATITLEGEIYNVDLMDDEEYGRYRAEEKRVGRMLIALANPDSDGDTQANAVTTAQEALATSVIKKKVKGINGQRDARNRRLKMLFPDKVELVDLIVQKSRLGRTTERL